MTRLPRTQAEIPVAERLTALARCDLLRDLDDESRARLHTDMRLLRLRPRQRLWSDGDPAHSLYVVVRGHIRVYRTDPFGNEIVLHMWGPGESVGEPGLWAPSEQRTAGAAAVDEAACLAVSKPDLRRWLEQHVTIATRLLERLAALTHQHARMMTEATSLEVAARVAVRLLELADSHGEDCDEGVRIALPLTQRTLAGMVVASRENVNRALSRFSTLGAISLEEGRIILHRPHLLRELSQEPRWKARID